MVASKSIADLQMEQLLLGGAVIATSEGAIAATRYVGGTVSGAPVTGTFNKGDFVIAQNGMIWINTVAGSPGTWVLAQSGAYAALGGAGKPAPGTYFRTVANQSAAAATQSLMGLTAVRIADTLTVDRIGCNVTVVAASSVVRLGIYSSDSGGLPSALLLDAGTVDSAVGTGVKEITISQVLVPGVYWLAGVSQGGAPTVGVVTSSGWQGLGYYAGMVVGDLHGTNPVGLTKAGVTGALPAPTGLTWGASQMHTVHLRAA